MKPLLIRVYQHPLTVLSFKDDEWDLLIRQARKSGMLSSLAFWCDDHQLLDQIPLRPAIHLRAAKRFSNKHASDILWEVHKLEVAFSEIHQPLILLKGAAYLAAKLPNSRGRLFQDTDVLISNHDLPRIESQLNKHGWYQAPINDYDERYYRRWAHELPPMRHLKRKALLDVHHRITQPTHGRTPSTTELLEQAVPLADRYASTLAPADMILHSMVHLFNDGEFDHALRDLVDIDQLFRHFNHSGQLLSELSERAEQLGLTRPLYYGCRYLHKILAVDYLDESDLASLPDAPTPALLALMDWLFIRAIEGIHPSCSQPGTGWARWCLYVRGHFLRMPIYRLIPHLLYKAIQPEAKPAT